jgi:hypothetical protein
MHPEMLRQLINQHNRETIARVQEDRLASRISRALRSQRRHGQVAGHDNYAIPAIPDFVDGSFMNAEGQANGATGGVPAARNAA